MNLTQAVGAGPECRQNGSTVIKLQKPLQKYNISISTKDRGTAVFVPSLFSLSLFQNQTQVKMFLPFFVCLRYKRYS